MAPRIARIAGLDAGPAPETGQTHPLRMARELAKRMAPDALFVGDGANCNNWYKATFRMQTSPGFLDHEPFGAMGTGLPYAIGAAAAFQEDGSSRQVYLGTGDGAFGQYLAELASASLHGLAIFVMVANDGTWVPAATSRCACSTARPSVDLNQSRYDLVAEGLECHGEFAPTPADVAPTFDRALAAVRAGKTAVVNVLVDRVASGDRADPLVQMISFNRLRFGGV